MWVFKNNAFVSVVQDRTMPDQLWARARVKGDLERFFDELNLDVIETNDADYRFRTAVSRDEVAQALTSSVEALDYTNFKSSIDATAKGDRRHRAYLRVWQAMMGYQQEEKGVEEQAARRKGKKKGPQARA